MSIISKKAPRFSCLRLPAVGEVLALDPTQSHHLSSVLRAVTGDSIELVDGYGEIAIATVQSIIGGIVEVAIHGKTQVSNSGRSVIHVAFGLTKSASVDFILRRCTEVGVSGFQPLNTAHSQRYSDWNSKRWEKIIIEVSKQCQQARFPTVNKPMDWRAFLANVTNEDQLVVCDEAERKHSAQTLVGNKTWLLIGPEGGWSDSERADLASRKTLSMGLGRNRLRAETACLVGLTLLKNYLQEFNH